MKEALKLALEALETLMDWQTLAPAGTQRTARKAITAIEEALAQPERPWIGLTDEERDAIEAATLDLHGIPKFFATAIEAKLKAVNGFLKEKNT